MTGFKDKQILKNYSGIMVSFLFTKYLVNGGIWRKSAIKDGELSLEPLRDVITTSTRLDHGPNELDVNDVGEVAWFLQAVHAMHLHHLSHNLISHLQEIQSAAL